MGRSRGRKEKIRYETESVRQKCFENQILHLVRSEFGVCQAESVSVVKEALGYIARTRGDCRGLFDLRLPVLAGRQLQRKVCASRGPCLDAVLSVVAEDDLDLYLESGMRAVQVCRIVRLVEQTDFAGGTLHLGLLSSLVHLTSRTIISRLKPLWRRGMSLPVLGVAESIRGDSSRLSLVLSDHLAQRSVQQVRGELFLSAVAYGQLLETASFVAQGYLDGRTTEELSTSFDLSPTVVESLISVVQQASANQPHQRRLQELLDSSVLASASTSAPQLGMGHPLASRSAFCAYLMRRHLFSASRAELFCAALDEATDQQSGYQRASGDIAFFAIAQDEPAGKARVDCELVTTILPFYLPNEDTVPRGTVGELKIRKAVRLAASARNQGGLLCLPDLAFLLGMGISALQRAIAKSNVFIPTRGNIMDIGRGVTHRVLIVKLYVEGHTESQIVRRTHHTYDSVASYLSDFSRVMLLVDQGLSATHIRKILQRSLSLINHYITLYNQLDVPQNQWKLNLMRQAAKKQKKKQRRTQ